MTRELTSSTLDACTAPPAIDAVLFTRLLFQMDSDPLPTALIAPPFIAPFPTNLHRVMLRFRDCSAPPEPCIGHAEVRTSALPK